MPPDQRPFNVLFLCTGNSARSILAECLLARLGGDRFRAFSAGSTPTGQVHPAALELLRDAKHPVGALRSKSWDEFAGPEAPPIDFLFTVCDRAAAESCPVWPGHPMSVHWGVPDPAAATGGATEIAAAFAETYRLLEARIDAFVNLPLASLDRIALKKKLEAIGQAESITPRAQT